MRKNIFIYGTLKRGEPNHWLIKKLRKHVTFLSEGSSKELYPLVTDPKTSNVPILIDCRGEGQNVQGQVYVADEKGEKVLDKFERLDDVGEYKRINIEIILANKFLKKSEQLLICECYAYNGTEEEIDRLKALPRLKEYSAKDTAYEGSEEDIKLGSELISRIIGLQFGDRAISSRREFTDDSSDRQQSSDT